MEMLHGDELTNIKRHKNKFKHLLLNISVIELKNYSNIFRAE